VTDEKPDATYSPDLPQTGWTTETPWCRALQINKEEFISLLERFRVPHVLFGRTVLIDVSKFYQHMSASLEKALSQPARPIVQRRPDNAAGSEKFPLGEPSFAVLTKRQVAELLQCSQRQVELLVQKGQLPSPVYLGDASPRWKLSEIEAVFDAAPRERRTGGSD
jgi:predicted DNA-binding transcriptional regulator AlpA